MMLQRTTQRGWSSCRCLTASSSSLLTPTRSLVTTSRNLASIKDAAASQLAAQVHAQTSGAPSTSTLKGRKQSQWGAQAANRSGKTALQDAKEEKLRKYAKLLKAKAAEEGVETIEELAEKRRAEKAAAVANATAAQAAAASSSSSSSADLQGKAPHDLEKRDQEMAARIRALAEAAAKRKLETGELHSNPNGDNGPIKPLSSIIDTAKLSQESPERISELWTGYHTMKGKVSAAIPTDVYEKLISTARKCPQFVLPLPREIVGGPEEDSPVQHGEKKQGYEIEFMEWGFLPTPGGASSADAPKVPTPTTVLFTPLAEYKLRQEFAQPLLVLTHYTDLARSKGLVLMRGEITSNEEIEAAPTGIAAAEAAKAKGASTEEQERLKAPVQREPDAPVSSSSSPTAPSSPSSPSSGGGARGISAKDAQLLVMTMQRFYLANEADTKGRERKELLEQFHGDQEQFSVQKLCDVAFAL